MFLVDVKDVMLKNAFSMDESALLAVKALPEYGKCCKVVPN